MNLHQLHEGDLRLTFTEEFAAIWSFEWIIDGVVHPLFRKVTPENGAVAGQAACFPLVPFGNRVRDNAFQFEGETYHLQPNTIEDPHYLHGDGWLAPWEIESLSRKRAELVYRHRLKEGSPYQYQTRQIIDLSSDQLEVALKVINSGETALPFGLGLHPFLPLTPLTTLRAKASQCWKEDHQFLPIEKVPIPAELDFNEAKTLPNAWTNTGFENWDGLAEIDWPERKLKLTISTDEADCRYLLFRPDAHFDPSYREDYFCFEPMTHTANGHNLGHRSGLKRLEPNQSMTFSIAFVPTHRP